MARPTPQEILARDQEIVFTNWTEEDFDGKWAKRIYRMQTNKSYFLPFYLAEHFAKHLVTRELNRMAHKKVSELKAVDPRIDRKELQAQEEAIVGNLQLRQDLMDRCIERPEGEQRVDIVVPRQAPTREVTLKTHERTANLVASGRLSPQDLGPHEVLKSNKPAQPAEASFEGA